MVRWVGQSSDIIALHTWGKLGHGGFGKLNHAVCKSIPQEVNLGSWVQTEKTIQYHILLSEMM